MQVTAAAIKAQSDHLKDLGISHIILASGEFIVEADRESSKKAVQKWRKSPAYKAYLALVNKLKASGKYGVNGGYGVRKQKKLNKATGKKEWTGKYEIFKMDSDEVAHRRAISKGMYKSTRVNHPKERDHQAELKNKIASKHGKPAAKAPVRRAARD